MRSSLASVEPPAPCARCQQRVAGVKWGELCPDCKAQLLKRASPVVRAISFGAALLVIGYAWLWIPLGPVSRLWVAGVAVGTYFVVRKIANQIALEIMRKPFGGGP